MPTFRLDEADPADQLHLTEAAGGGARRRMLLITPGWGSSGYYPADVLERDAATAFPAGTHMYLDHPGDTEAADRARVGRSVRDLAAVTESAGAYDRNGPEGPGVYATARIVEQYAPLINDLAEHIGVSVRGTGVAEAGEVEGRRTRIVKALNACESVDFVTRAGRGGRVLQLVENLRTVEALSANELHDRLEQIVRDRVDDDDCFVWVRDYSTADGWVVWRTGDTTWRADLTVDGDTVTVGDDPVEVEVRTDYVPVDQVTEAATEARTRVEEARNVGQWHESIHLAFTERADHAAAEGRLTRDERIALSHAIGAALDAFTTQLETDAPHLYDRDPHEQPDPATPTPTIQEAHVATPAELEAQVSELTTRIATIEADRDTQTARADTAEAELNLARVTEAARVEARRLISESDVSLPDPAVDRVVADVTRQLPLTESGELDTEPFATAVTEAAAAEASYLGIAAAPGARVVGLGESRGTAPDGDGVDSPDAELNTTLAEAFNRPTATIWS